MIDSLSFSADIMAHWLVSYTYLRCVYETETLLDKELHIIKSAERKLKRAEQ